MLYVTNPVAVLATLFLFSYTKLFRTIITAMSFTYLDYPKNPSVPVWLHDGNVGYLDAKHIALFVAALVGLVFPFLPYTLVIFFGQWIEARSQLKLFGWISNYRVKAFLDAYHGPLRNNHRYWPGLLLVSRAVLLLVSALNAFGDPSSYQPTGLHHMCCWTADITVNHWECILQNSSSSLGNIVSCKLSISCCICWYNSTGTDRGKPTFPHLYLCGHCLSTFIGILVYHTLTQVRDSRIWKDTIKLRLHYSQRGQPRGTLVELDGQEEGLVIHPAPVDLNYFCFD